MNLKIKPKKFPNTEEVLAKTGKNTMMKDIKNSADEAFGKYLKK